MNKVEEKQTSFTNVEKIKHATSDAKIECTCLVIWKIRFLRYVRFSYLSNILISIRSWMILEEAMFDNGSLKSGGVQMAPYLKFNCFNRVVLDFRCGHFPLSTQSIQWKYWGKNKARVQRLSQVGSIKCDLYSALEFNYFFL